jgi:hypothetical protein
MIEMMSVERRDPSSSSSWLERVAVVGLDVVDYLFGAHRRD